MRIMDELTKFASNLPYLKLCHTSYQKVYLTTETWWKNDCNNEIFNQQEEAANLTFDKMLATVRQNGVVQGTMYLFLLYFSAKLTKGRLAFKSGSFCTHVETARLFI